MASSHNFRSALNGFNREDVVHYLEYLNARQQAEQNRLQAEIGRLTAEVERLQKAPAPQDVTGELEAANRRCAELEERCTRLQAELEQVLKDGTRFYKIKSRNMTGTGIDMIVELKTKDEGALMEKVLAIPAVESATLMTHDGEITY